jgi:hypothetical protein
MGDMQTQDEPTPRDRGKRLAYEPPRIERLGPVAELTAGPFGGSSDSVYGGNGGFFGS